jgi:hypothetical protein
LLDTIDLSWQHILYVAEAGKFEYVLSLESDIIAPPETIDVMVDMAEFNNAILVRHAYDLRSGFTGHICALGCTLMRAKYYPPLFRESQVLDIDGSVYHEERRFMHVALELKKPAIDLYNVLNLVHLSEGPEIDVLPRHVERIQMRSV